MRYFIEGIAANFFDYLLQGPILLSRYIEGAIYPLLENLKKLQSSKAGTTSSILTTEQQTELENFRTKAVETRRVLKELRKNLRVETDALEFWTKVVNIGLVPLLVALAGLGAGARQAPPHAIRGRLHEPQAVLNTR